ncbi:DUF3813 domain-containing protein [Peribacillus frigoritolerans]|jgi:uncharacterized protein DUF3813|uniref:DUF3813 domain-containing protein n=1 Tax=Bacillaceae TaxID=186817 RepID=UPI0007111600|nr:MULTISPECIES: DUF3813 domain-containing protein [Bacillaceae]KRF60207.1 hypothetical protein ASG97_02215 [Bacillus sp. Soil745]MDP9742382.1 hypothetical protein [Bacillus sp. B2I3]PAW30805.1 hypothetical protein BKC07_00150 [Peribacillus simplex]PHD78387.1 DUF3813 domain-containing protein [Bacillus sp. AFS043905]PRS40223.1 DUF3813 domain-containing protein [Bacillus sp. RJGP41]QNK50713.1 DUF3813 domain-containing protein [Brevibacterium sp. PAMC23299]
MGNKLFQKAREFVEEALHSEHDGDQHKTEEFVEEALHSEHDGDQHKTEEIAKNALSSAFANTNEAEKEQLRELQQELENHSK